MTGLVIVQAVQAMAGALPTPRRRSQYIRGDNDAVTWTARCPHGRDTTWSAVRVERPDPIDPGSYGGTRISCPCPCTEPAP